MSPIQVINPVTKEPSKEWVCGVCGVARMSTSSSDANRDFAEECCTPYPCPQCGVICKDRLAWIDHNKIHWVIPTPPTEEEIEAEHSRFVVSLHDMEFDMLWDLTLDKASDYDRNYGFDEPRKLDALKNEFQFRLKLK